MSAANKLSNQSPTSLPSSPFTPSDGSLGFNHHLHHKPKLTVNIDSKPIIEMEAHKIDSEGNIVNSPNQLSDKQLEKMGKKQLKINLLEVQNNVNDLKMEEKQDGEQPKKCSYHKEMNASWICVKCKRDVCELCSMSKMAVSNPMVCHHCFDERAKNLNMIWLWIGLFCIGIVCPPLMVVAPIVIILRSQNEKFKRVGWISFWLISVGLFLLMASALIVIIALKYSGQLN